MGLLTEVLSRIGATRLVELTRKEASGGIQATTLAGTVTVTNGSAAVLGVGTAFTSFGVNQVIQFASQPGVSYVVSAIADATHLTLAQNFTGVTTAGTTAALPSINYVTLQNAVYDAQAHFQGRTNFAFDDVTQNSGATNPLTLNKCIYAGVALVVAYLYEYRGHPFPDAEIAAAWQTADRRLNEILHAFGDGAFSAPVSDSVFQPSTGQARLPAFDSARFGNLTPNGPGPTDIDGAGGGLASEY